MVRARAHPTGADEFYFWSGGDGKVYPFFFRHTEFNSSANTCSSAVLAGTQERETFLVLYGREAVPLSFLHKQQHYRRHGHWWHKDQRHVVVARRHRIYYRASSTNILKMYVALVYDMRAKISWCDSGSPSEARPSIRYTQKHKKIMKSFKLTDQDVYINLPGPRLDWARRTRK